MVGKKSVFFDENFTALARKAFREGITWNDLLSHALPAGLSAHETWGLLTRLRRYAAVDIPFQEAPEYRLWYAPTATVTSQVAHLDELCRCGSTLEKTLYGPDGDYYRTLFQVNETVNCAWRDRIILDTDRALKIFRQGAPSKSPEAKLLYNIFHTMESLDSYLDEPFSPELIGAIIRKVSRGVDFKALSHRRDGNEASWQYPEIDEVFRVEQLERLCAYANGDVGDGLEHPILKAALLRTGFCGFCPRQNLAFIVSQLLFNLFVMKSGLPVLALIPFTECNLRWEGSIGIHARAAGRPMSENLGAQAQGITDEERHLTDYTPLAALAVGLMTEATAQLESFIDGQEAQAAAFLAQLQGDPNLNRRQLILLENVYRSGEEGYTIRLHEMNQKISYATARTDVLELVERGYLCQTKRGKSYFFLPGPALASA